MLQTFCGVTSRMVQWWLLEFFRCCLLRLRISALSPVGVAVTEPKFASGWGLPFLPCIPPSLDCSLYVKPLQAYTVKKQHPEWTDENTGSVYLILLSVYLKKFPIKPALHTLSMWLCGVCLHLLLHIFSPSVSFILDIVHDVFFSYARFYFYIVKSVHLLHDFWISWLA